MGSPILWRSFAGVFLEVCDDTFAGADGLLRLPYVSCGLLQFPDLKHEEPRRNQFGNSDRLIHLPQEWLEVTTVMMRNLPNKPGRPEVLKVVRTRGNSGREPPGDERFSRTLPEFLGDQSITSYIPKPGAGLLTLQALILHNESPARPFGSSIYLRNINWSS